MRDFELKLLEAVLRSEKSRKIRDNMPESLSFSEDIEQLSKCLKEAIVSRDSHKNLIAEKYCLFFEYSCAVNQKEKDRLNDRLLKLADAQESLNLVMDEVKYRLHCEKSHLGLIKEFKGYIPYHGCAVFIKTQLDSLSRSGQAPLTEAEKHLWELRRENLKACREEYQRLQRQALFREG